MRTLVEALDDAARSDEGYTFVWGGLEHRRSYREIRGMAHRTAQSLRRAGLDRADLVALAITDAEAFLTAFFGCAVAGIVPASLAPPATTADWPRYFELTAGILRTARARAVIVSAPFVGGFEAIKASCPSLAMVLSPHQLMEPLEPLEPFEPFEPSEPSEPSQSSSIDDLAFVQFTSGSTSAPKGVALSHRNLCANIEAINGPSGLAVTAADSAVSWLPLYHDMGLIGMALGPLYSSRPAVLLPPQVFIKRPAVWLQTISQHRATVSFAPNFAYRLLLRRLKDRDLDGLDLSSWRVAGCGSEPIHAATLEAFADRLACVGFRASSLLPCYGLAEHVLAAALSPCERPLRTSERAPAWVSCGRALPGHAIKLVREDGGEAENGQTGEIVLAGPSVMLGYYNDAPATAQAISGGWLRTGDLGYLSDGELFVCGRVKETIIVNGCKYHPQDLEWALEDVEVSRTAKAIAFGVPEHGAGDRIVIVVESRDAGSVDSLASAIRRRIAEAFGLYVDEIVRVPPGTIGRTTSGKVRRAAIKAWYERERPQPANTRQPAF